MSKRIFKNYKLKKKVDLTTKVTARESISNKTFIVISLNYF